MKLLLCCTGTAAVAAFTAIHKTLLVALLKLFLPLSLITFGGVNAILPELYRSLVEESHWLSAVQFYELLALAFAAPGPNILFVTMVGSRVAGLAGALVATVTMIGLPAMCFILFVRWWFRSRPTRWRAMLQTGLLPVTTGIFAAAALSIIRAVVHGPVSLLVCVGTFCAALRLRAHPLWFLGVGGVIGALGWN